ncbi:MAG TPA: DNA-3-methyladenine glycosylase [Candidatus Aquilonibacter sp.]|jgi:DNA-3-methyladenine glycosylase II|nr:DNA-3-methyladenine glycosylase [Candidatus Aquilonibacter sp.]
MRKAVNHLKKSDPILRAIIERIGPCRMRYNPPEFRSLAEAIVYQQLNGKAAITIFKRFTNLAGEPLIPEGILKLTDEQMRSAGLSKQKSSYLKDLAAKTAAGILDFSRLAALPDAEVIEHLTQIKGVGVWTAQMFLMFTLKRGNVLPTGDFGVRMAMYKHYLDVQRAKTAKRSAISKKRAAKKTPKRKIKLPTPEQMEKIAERWQPYRSVACWYLWRSLDVKTI